MRFFRRFRWPLVLLLSLGLAAFLLAALQLSALAAPSVSSATVAGPSSAVAAPSRQGEGGVLLTNSAERAAACQHSGLAPDLAKQEFGWDASYLNKKYLKVTLCDDTLLSLVAVTCRPAQQLFQLLGWPQDLIVAPYNTQVVCTKAHQAATVLPPSSSSGSDSCLLNGLDPFQPINLCDMFNTVIQAAANNLAQGVHTIATQTEMLIDGIPASWTYRNPAVTAMWSTMVGAVDVLVGLVILWTGLRYLTTGTNAIEYASIIEVIPRLALTLLVVHFSLTLAQFTIDFFNALCATVQGSLIPSVLIGGDNNLSIFAGFLGMFHSLLALLVILQAALEIAGIVVVIPLGPLCLLCLFHPDTQRIARTWISAFGALCIMRFLQVLALVLGEQMLAAGFLNSMPSAEILNLVLGIGVLGIAVMIPGMLRQWILVPITGGGRMVVSAFSTAATFFMIGGR
ncbi:MAG TPA: hypothetical protein VFV38_50070 [Ktedonobacteraceae bacterium]|nr:hypothetical protein [Ktedonobacteraceae bacterium]